MPAALAPRCRCWDTWDWSSWPSEVTRRRDEHCGRIPAFPSAKDGTEGDRRIASPDQREFAQHSACDVWSRHCTVPKKKQNKEQMCSEELRRHGNRAPLLRCAEEAHTSTGAGYSDFLNWRTRVQPARHTRHTACLLALHMNMCTMGPLDTARSAKPLPLANRVRGVLEYGFISKFRSPKVVWN